jgi:hypothetical protein
MVIDKNKTYADVIVALDRNIPNAVYHLFFVHESDNEVVHLEKTYDENISLNKARLAHFKVETASFKRGGKYKLSIYAKEAE